LLDDKTQQESCPSSLPPDSPHNVGGEVDPGQLSLDDKIQQEYRPSLLPPVPPHNVDGEIEEDNALSNPNTSSPSQIDKSLSSLKSKYTPSKYALSDRSYIEVIM